MVKRTGPTGPFLGCSGYGDKKNPCSTTMKLDAEGNPVLTAKPTEHVCEKCGKPMVLRDGRLGPFLSCSGYPKCKNAKNVDAQGNPIPEIDLGIACEKCNAPMKVRKGPRGPFLGCSAFPKCRGTKQLTAEQREQLKDVLPPAPPKKAVPEVEVTETCPECSGAMKLRSGPRGYFLSCAKFPRCKGKRTVSPEMMEQLQQTEAAGAST
jgi:DNA topoisomerase-1